MLDKTKSWFKGLSIASKVAVIAGASVLGLAAVGSALPCNGNVTYYTVQGSVAYSNTNVNDNTLAKGTTKVTTKGVTGQSLVKHQKTTYTPNGCQQNKDAVVSSQITTKPVDQVTAVGTYVAPAPAPTPAPTPSPTTNATTQTSCPNGTYTNSSGNEVCSPYSSPSAPAGATAQCVDGTYSFSQSRSGTCSHHGGVATWL